MPTRCPLRELPILTESTQPQSTADHKGWRENAGMPEAWAKSCLVVLLIPVKDHRIGAGGKDLGECRFGALEVDPQQSLI